MPFYEYECSHCRFYVEVMQKLSDAPLRKCPSCGKNGLKKLISAPVFRLKGSGWYETDFKSEQEQKRNLAGAEKKEEASADKAEAKPEPAKEAAADSKAAPAAETKGKSETKAEPKRAASKRRRSGAVARPARSARSGKRKAGKPRGRR